MSYILDALRKSAEERRKVQAKEQQSYEPLVGHDSSRRNRSMSPAALILALTVLAVVVLAGSWFLVADRRTVEVVIRDDKPAAAQQPAVTPQAEVPSPAPAPAATAAPPVPAIAETQKSAAEQEARPTAPNEPESAPGQAGLDQTAQIPLLQELPFATQAAIPELKFSGHVYSAEPDLRMVMVNTAIVREGDMISPDIRLIEIIDNGLVLEFRQTRFRVELF
jgi:hypothetical protein